MTKPQLEADVKFLAARSMSAASFSFGDRGRDTGMSSNSIVGIIYGVIPRKQQILPSDQSDLDACQRMWNRLPQHRKTKENCALMGNARDYKNLAKTASF